MKGLCAGTLFPACLFAFVARYNVICHQMRAFVIIFSHLHLAVYTIKESTSKICRNVLYLKILTSIYQNVVKLYNYIIMKGIQLQFFENKQNEQTKQTNSKVDKTTSKSITKQVCKKLGINGKK